VRNKGGVRKDAFKSQKGDAPMNVNVVLAFTAVVQLMLLFQNSPRRGSMTATWVELMYSFDPLMRSMFHPDDRERAAVDHCESSMV
jgi:hypothetical protein